MDELNFLFEISWEVCNKVGGIHTVLASKAKFARQNFKNYFVIGPFRGEGQTEFTEKEIPQNYKQVFDELNLMGIKVHYGVWNIDNSPTAFLIEYMDYSKNINDIKGRIWDIAQVDSLGSNWYDFDEAILWSWTAGVFIEKFSNAISQKKSKTIVHSHEWMAGGAIFYMRNISQNNSYNQNKFKTIFTTHATMLGRALSGSGANLYEIKNKIKPDEKAVEVGVKTKHLTEKGLAKISDVFTTVSQITGDEAEIFYGKKPDKLLYNGFDYPDLDLVDNFYMLYEKSREKWNEFLTAYFTRFYDINLDNTQIFFASGRNEFRTKGIDIYLKSLNQLNEKLKEETRKNKNQNENENQKNNLNVKDVVGLILIPIGNFKPDETLVKSVKGEYQRTPWDYAPLSTHNVPMENEYIQALFENNLRNYKNDKVKVVLCPVYLDGKDGVINMAYYDAVFGLDLGIFASFYEPWGYTPLECIALGVPTVTTNLAGFGRTIIRDYSKYKIVNVIDRETSQDKEVVDNLSNFMFNFTQKSTRDLMIEKAKNKLFAEKFSWKKFYLNYLEAYNKLLK